MTATLAKKDASDIVEILQFLACYVADRAGSIQRIDRILNQGLVTATGTNLFAGRFAYLNTCGLPPEQIFNETLATIFNAPGGGQLHVENLKGATGEVALRLGAENEAFGVINVGDDAKLVKLCEETGLDHGRARVLGVALPRDQQAAFDGAPADWLEEVHRGLEQLARLDDGSDERGQGRGRADHPALRARRAAQGLRSEPQTQRQDATPRRRRAAQTHRCARGARHIRHPCRLHGAVPGLPRRGRSAHQRRPHRVSAAGDQEPRDAEAQDDPAQEDDQRRQHRIRGRIPQARARSDRRSAGPRQ